MYAPNYTSVVALFTKAKLILFKIGFDTLPCTNSLLSFVELKRSTVVGLGGWGFGLRRQSEL